MSELYKETTEVRHLKNGHTIVGTTPVPLAPIAKSLTRGILVRCPGPDDPVPNTSPVWIGAANVTPNAAENGGLIVLPGIAIHLPIDDGGGVYVVSTDEAQDIAWLSC